MSLDDVVNVTITAQTVAPTRLGFGTPLLMAYHTVTPNRVDLFKSLAEISDAGFGANHPVTKMATKVFSQNPRPSQVVVGKRALPFTQIVRLTPVNVTIGYTYRFAVIDRNGVRTDIEYTVVTGTVAAIVAGLVALIDPVVDVTAADATTHATLTAAAAGQIFDLQDLPNPNHMKVRDMTTDPGIATDLSAVEALDPTTWYMVHMDSESEPQINAAAAWIEARRKQGLFTTSDSGCVDNGDATDVGSDLKAAAYARTSLIFISNSLKSFAAAAWAGGMLPTDPGAGTWCYRTLKGVTVNRLTGAQTSALDLKNVNHYTVVGGVNVTQKGKSGSGEFIDITHFVDWLHARLQERIFGILANASAAGKKIPYTDSGVDTMRAAILAQLSEGVRVGGLAADPAPVVTAPKVKDVDPSDKINRRLPDMVFTGTLAGAIHTLVINGTLSV